MVMGEMTLEADVAIIGGGPGGYVAAIRAADLGLNVVLIEERDRLGGVCLIEGCIPSKTLIHAADLIDNARHAEKLGLRFGEPELDLNKLRKWTESVVGALTKGVATLLDKRDVEIVRGHAHFESKTLLHVDGANTYVEFKHAIIATGSRINKLPEGSDLPLWSSADALAIPEIPSRLLVVGGGYIGLELGLLYSGLGSNVTVVEFLPELLTGVDRDLVNVVVKHCKQRFEAIHTDSKVVDVRKSGKGFEVDIQHGDEVNSLEFDKVLVAIGRTPNTDDIGLDKIGITVDERGLIPTDEQGRTTEPHIFAIGDITRGPALAHKASREGKVAAEVISGLPSAFDNRAVPAVVFTHPEIAWTGLSELKAKEKGIPYTLGKFPHTALGRARTIGQTDGFVKILADPDTKLVLGVGIVGPSASELIAEGTLAIEMGATLEDLIVSIHPHPTLSESIMEAAEVAAGEPTHILPRKKKP